MSLFDNLFTAVDAEPSLVEPTPTPPAADTASPELLAMRERHRALRIEPPTCEAFEERAAIMEFDSLLALLKAGVTDVTAVQPNKHGASGCNGTETAAVTDVTPQVPRADSVTPVTATNLQPLQPKATETGACTHVTAVTSEISYTGAATGQATPTLPACEADTCEAFEERAAIMEFDAGLPRVEAERLAREQTCKACEHFAMPGKSDGYCGAEALRDVLEPAYGAGHPLRKPPDDHGAACMAFSGVNAYELNHPVTRLETGDDDRRTCRQCGNLSKMRGDVCTIAIPGGLVSARKGYQPQPDVLQRCAGYAPGADDQDQRTGVERWPGLASI